MKDMIDFVHGAFGIKPKQIYFPAQCKCGHLFLERYKINNPDDGKPIGFCWCGFCRTRLNIFSDNSFKYVEGAHHDKD